MWGHISWYPMRQPGWAAVANFWVASRLRRQGLGRYLLALALHDMAHAPAPRGGYQGVEVQSHLVHHPVAVALYEKHGFRIDEVWVSLVKT
jgi:ribosomal protein S18 acetylase RimI-like enzyme